MQLSENFINTTVQNSNIVGRKVLVEGQVERASWKVSKNVFRRKLSEFYLLSIACASFANISCSDKRFHKVIEKENLRLVFA